MNLTGLKQGSEESLELLGKSVSIDDPNMLVNMASEVRKSTIIDCLISVGGDSKFINSINISISNAPLSEWGDLAMKYNSKSKPA